MLRFYNEKPIKRMVNTISKPFQVRFKDRLKDIEAYSQNMSLFANALALRDSRDSNEAVMNMLGMIFDMCQSEHCLEQIRDCRIDFCIENLQITKDHTLAINDTRNSQMILAAKSSVFPRAADISSIRFASIKLNTPSGLDVSNVLRIRTVNIWSTKLDSALLLIRGSKQIRQQTEIVGMKMVQVIRRKSTPVLFAFQAGRGSKHITTTPAQILQYLLEQALKLNEENLTSLVNENFNATRVSSATTIEHWAQLLSSAIRNLPLVYIYVDLDLINPGDPSQDSLSDLVRAMEQVWQSCPSTAVKVAFVSHQRTLKVKNAPAQILTLDIGKMKRR